MTKFTIHFATINTGRTFVIEDDEVSFTIHFATINTKVKKKGEKMDTNLQYTLLLLILYHVMFSAQCYEIYNTLCYY